MMNSRIRLLSVGLGIVCAAPLFGQTYAVVSKERRFVQTGATTTVPRTTDGQPFMFEAQAEGSPTSPTVTPPSGTARTLTPSPDGDGGVQFRQEFATQAALDAAFPNGTYTLSLNGRSAALALNGDLYPAAPVATLSQGTFTNGVLNIDRSQPLTITISFSQNYAAGLSHLGISVFGGNSSTFVDIGAENDLTQQTLSFTVPANRLAAGVNYTIELSADRAVSIDATSIPGYLAVPVYSAFTIIQVGSPGGTGTPTITAQPQSQTVAAGNTVVFSAAATNATTLQWRFNGSPIPGAVGPTLVLSGPSVVAGRYSVLATNATGATAPSSEATLSIVNTTNVGRLINLSILTPLSAGESMTMGTVLGGQGTSGTKPLLARAAGPSLGQLGVTGFLADPAMTLVNTSSNTTVGTNSGWGGSATLAAAFSSVGAFPYASLTSRDSAIFQQTLPAANYTVQVRSDSGIASGTVIAELYDATPTSSFSATTPRLINVSVLKQIAAGTSLTAGFVVGGSSAKTVLVRAIGPRLGLAPFSIPGAMPAPTMTLVNLSTNATLARNSGWGGDPQILNVANRVGAFAVTDPSSRDAMLLLTLAPGNYTAEISPATGTAGGTAIVEVYEVP